MPDLPEAATAPRPTPQNETGHRSWRTVIWAGLNSSFGLWFFSSVVLGTAVYGYQTWQDSRKQQETMSQQIDKLNLEISGRLSQFGTWARDNMLYEYKSSQYKFKPDVTLGKIEDAIGDLASSPHAGGDGHRLYIHEILPDFSSRNLISLYAEAHLIVLKIAEQNCHCKIVERQAKFSILNQDTGENSPMTFPFIFGINKHSTSITDLDIVTASYITKLSQYKEAEVALLEPKYLLRYHDTPDHDTFVRSFEGIFLTDDTKRSGLPSTDCLENRASAGECISYPESSQAVRVSQLQK